MDFIPSPMPLFLACAGALSHLLFFIQIDPISYAPALLVGIIFAPALLTGALHILTSASFLNAAVLATTWYCSYLSGVYSSMIVYRLLFHRLRSYPGPFFARLSQLVHVFSVVTHVNNFRRLEQLHEQYGEYVRIGPNMISIADPAAVTLTHGQTSKFTKSNWYEVARPLTSLHQMTDPATHDQRRRHGWDKAFTASALRSYDSRIVKYTDQLVEQLRKRSGTTVDATAWLGYFAFDVMGDLAFGKSFDALQKGTSHWFMDSIRSNGVPLGTLGTATWIAECIMRLVPGPLNPMKKLIDGSTDMVEKRRSYKPEEPDVMSYILDAGPFFPDKRREDLLLTGDARLLVVAGSDTTSATLTFAIYHLAKDPKIVEALRKELDGCDLTIAALSHLGYLNSIINETLRLYPAVPSGVYRRSPPGGITINGHFVPGGCIVQTPQHIIQRSSKAFAEPLEFMPERWTTQPELIRDKNAFFPFLIGKYGCIGKQLALNEMRSVLTKLVLEFDLAFAKGEDGYRLLNETQDHFTLGVAPLEVIFTTRKS